MAIVFLEGVMTVSVALANEIIQISWEIKKWLVYKDFILKDTNLFL